MLPADRFRQTVLGSRPSLNANSDRLIGRERLQAKRVLSRWNHCQWHRGAAPASMHMLVLKPRTQTGVINLRLTLPEIGSQSTLDSQMIQL